MAFTPDFSTGFEPGSLGVLGSAANYADIEILAVNAHTGTYCIHAVGVATASYIRINGNWTDVYVTIWIDPDTAFDTDNEVGVWAHIEGGGYNLKVNLVAGYYDAYVHLTKVADGSIAVPNEWHSLICHFVLDDTVGKIETRVEGNNDIAYTGDTNPGAGTYFDYIQVILGTGASDEAYADDVAVGTGGWPNALRYDVKTPNADTATEEWSLSGGSDSYALIDEIPPSDADYIYTSTNGQKTKSGLTNWDGTNKVADHVVDWGRAWKDSADDNHIKLLLDDGTESGGSLNLATSAAYVSRILMTPPSGGTWDEASINSLTAGEESMIV